MSKRFGIIGTGNWGNILRSKLCTLGSIVYFSNSRNFNQLPKSVDWVFVATPSYTHFEITRELLLSGFNVFVEKPPCISEKEFSDLVQAARIGNSKFFIDNVFLFRSEVRSINGLRDSKFIKFNWKKRGPYNDSIVMDLLYHDLYILLSFYEVDSFEVHFVESHENSFQLKALLNSIPVSFNYNRCFDGYIKSIQNQNGIIYINKSDEDPLLMLIDDLVNDRISISENINLNQRTIQLFEIILSSPGIKL